MLTLARKIRPARLYRAGLYYEKESKKDKNMIRIDDHELVFFLYYIVKNIHKFEDKFSEF